MSDFLQAILQVPTVLFSGLLGLSLLYWVLIILGAADLNALDGAEGAAKGAIEGAAKGLAEGAGDGLGAIKGLSAITDLLAFLGLTRVPVTISVSLFSLFGWFLSLATRQALDPVLPGVLSALAALGAGTAGGLGVTAFLTRPLGKLFTSPPRDTRGGVVGRVVRVTTERVDAGFGQGEIDDGAGGVTVSIRTTPGVTLKRGAEALVLEHDPARDVYVVEPHDGILPDERAAFEAAARAGAPHAPAPEPAPAADAVVESSARPRR